MGCPLACVARADEVAVELLAVLESCDAVVAMMVRDSRRDLGSRRCLRWYR